MLKNKYIISSVIATSLIFIGIKSFAITGKVNTETVKMRADASTDSKIVMLVSINDKVEIIEKSGDWYKVKFDGKTGFIYAKYVDTNEKVKQNSTQDTSKEQVEENVNTNSEQNSTQNTNNDVSQNNTNTKEQINQEEENNEEKNIPINCQVVTHQDTQIRLIPLINSSVVNNIKPDTTVTVIEYVNGWYYIKSSEIQGWIREENLNAGNVLKTDQEQNKDTNSKEETDNEKRNENKPEEKETIKYINTDIVNVRKKASKDSEIIKKLVKNAKVTVISTSNGWSKIEINGTEGYISSDYLSDSQVEEDKSSKDETNKTTNRTLETSRKDIVSTSNNNGESVVTYARTFLGAKYILGGVGPNSFDCSGFTAYVYKKFGISLAHSASAQANVGTKVEKSNLQLGDLVIFNGESNKSIGHVGIYIGGNQFIHASNPKDGVKITSLSTSYYATRYVTARRIL